MKIIAGLDIANQKRLQTDVIDLYYQHRVDANTPMLPV